MMYEFADVMWPGDREFEGNPDMQHIRDSVLDRLRERSEGVGWPGHVEAAFHELDDHLHETGRDDLNALLDDIGEYLGHCVEECVRLRERENG